MRSLLAWSVLAGCIPPHPPPDGMPPAPVSEEEHRATIEALAPPKRARPLIAVVASTSGAETTDVLVPYGVLRRSGVADVFVASHTRTRIELMPALALTTQVSFAELDAMAPDGMDYVVVPAQMDTSDAAVVQWLKAQAASGATIVGVCSGVQTLGHAGLLDGRRATGHWADLVDLQERYPTMTWVRDRRYVVDREVATTTGISASLPASLALVEAIAGMDHALAVAHELGVPDWSESHDSDAFFLDDGVIWTVLENELPFWNKQRVDIAVGDGVDEIALAFAADSFSRTYRSRAEAVSSTSSVRSLGGLQIDTDARSPGAGRFVLPDVPPGAVLERGLSEIERRYGTDTARFVAIQEEVAWP